VVRYGFCETLCVADINPEAVLACQRTIQRNGVSSATVYLSDNLSNVPASERWDLVVGNPPHFSDPRDYLPPAGYEILSYDLGWSIHRMFFAQLPGYLAPDSVAIIQENNKGSVPGDFSEMLADAGLRIVLNIGGHEQKTRQHSFYFLTVARQEGVVPRWLSDAATDDFSVACLPIWNG
jgi:methylase of polypeptide subunit release factors